MVLGCQMILYGRIAAWNGIGMDAMVFNEAQIHLKHEFNINKFKKYFQEYLRSLIWNHIKAF